MDIKQATTAYEAWLGKKIPLVAADLKSKHDRMTEGVFPFLRATFYRWARIVLTWLMLQSRWLSATCPLKILGRGVIRKAA